MILDLCDVSNSLCSLVHVPVFKVNLPPGTTLIFFLRKHGIITPKFAIIWSEIFKQQWKLNSTSWALLWSLLMYVAHAARISLRDSLNEISMIFARSDKCEYISA